MPDNTNEVRVTLEYDALVRFLRHEDTLADRAALKAALAQQDQGTGVGEAVVRDLVSDEHGQLHGPLGEAIAEEAGNYSLEFVMPEQIAQGFVAWLNRQPPATPEPQQEVGEAIPDSFWRSVPCGHPPDPVAVWTGEVRPACHCGVLLDPTDTGLPSPPEAPGPIVHCQNCGCHVAIPPRSATQHQEVDVEGAGRFEQLAQRFDKLREEVDVEGAGRFEQLAQRFDKLRELQSLLDLADSIQPAAAASTPATYTCPDLQLLDDREESSNGN